MNNFETEITEIASDVRSIFLWSGSLKDRIIKLQSENEDQEIIKNAIREKLEITESNLLAVASFVSDCEAALKDNNILTDLIAELKD